MSKPTTLIFILLLVIHGNLSCNQDSDLLIDIMIIVDGSASVGRHNFELVKDWLVLAVTEMADRFGSRAQFGVLEYSNYESPFSIVPIEHSTVFEIPFRLGECKNVQCMKARIDRMKYLQGQTFTYYAIRRVLEVEFPISPNAGVAKKAMILLTDGAATDGASIPQAYKKSVEQNITNFAIGVGNYQVSELREFANGGDSNKRVYTSTDFNSLSSVLSELEDELQQSGFFCDECVLGTHTCHKDATCFNTVDGYECRCNSGFEGDGEHCSNIDDCRSNSCPSENARCVDGLNAFRCECIDGFELKDGECQNIDDCASNPCVTENSECTDGVEGYICSCIDGYEWNGQICADNEGLDNTLVLFTLLSSLFIVVVLFVLCFCFRKRQRSYLPNRKQNNEEHLMSVKT